MSELQTTNPSFIVDMREIVLSARNNAIRSVEHVRKMMYWHLGERIFVEEQRGKDRAKYGEYLIRDISKKLEKEFGSGFTYTQLTRARKFYRLYPNVNDIRPQLNWYQYRTLICSTTKADTYGR